jgi:hypothetical protein
MSEYINGKLKSENTENLFGNEKVEYKPLQLTNEANEVLNSGRELWKYYNSFNATIPNASFYDIREFFQGRNDKGRMNSKRR